MCLHKLEHKNIIDRIQLAIMSNTLRLVTTYENLSTFFRYRFMREM